jgi:hypothetical protein
MWDSNIPTAAASTYVVMISKFVDADGGKTERSNFISKASNQSEATF